MDPVKLIAAIMVGAVAFVALLLLSAPPGVAFLLGLFAAVSSGVLIRRGNR